MVKPGSDELRQNVFSSTLMSTKLKSSNASITYPCCTFCGGSRVKGSPKRKVLLCTLSLYVNPSESFIVWGKKPDDPKGMLWLRSCCVRRGQERVIELISRGCRGRCSYTLKFCSAPATDDWYRSLRSESRRAPAMGDVVLPEDDDGRMSATLDALLTEMTPSVSESVWDDEEGGDWIDPPEMTPPFISISAPPACPLSLTAGLTGKKSKSKKSSKKKKGSAVFCSPLAALGSRKSSCPSYSASILPLESNENTPPFSEDLTRWSWPQAFSS